jgi:putative acetyltransferase
MMIRPEQPPDLPAIRRVNEAAFDRPDEADIVDRLRARGAITLSLVAEIEGGVVGHVLFSPVRLQDPAGPDYTGVGLGPVAVLPAHQRQGIGSALIRAGLEQVQAAGHPYCVVLGHPAYYPRFGFAPAGEWGIELALPVPPEVFMVRELQPGALAGRAGTITYEPELMGE